MTFNLTHNFDEDRQLLDVSSEEEIYIKDRQDLLELFQACCKIFKQYTKDCRIYLMMDITKIVIDPELAGDYANYLRRVYDKYAYPNGAIGYGSQIGRVTAKIAHEKYDAPEPFKFFTRSEAINYIDSLRDEMTLKYASNE